MLEWIVSSVVLILVVLLLRQITAGRISSRLRYALWLPVLLRLLVPLSFGGSVLSVINAIPGDLETAGSRPIAYLGYETPELSVVEPDPSLSEDERERQYQENLAQWEREMEAAKAATGRAITAGEILIVIWAAGAAAVLLCFAISNLRFAARLRRSRRALEAEAGRPVYVSAVVETPCLFGLLRPAIYLTPEAAEDENILRHVLAHESTHARHGDHIWSALRGLCLALHWYDPFVWLAARLSRQDAELACDEGTIQLLGEAERLGYGGTLISLATGRGGLLLTATTMTGGKKNLKERVALIAQKPRSAAIVVTMVLLIAAIAVVCTFSGGSGKEGWQSIDVKELDTAGIPFAVEGEISWPETAFVYEAVFDHSANEQEIRQLIGNKAGADGVFSIKDGHISLSNRSDMVRRIEMAIPYDSRPDATYGYQLLGISKDDYGSEDLDFMPLEEAAERALTEIEALGVTEGFSLREAYTIDKETLSRHTAMQLELQRDMGGISEEQIAEIYPFLYGPATEEDECYFFVFCLELDGVPALTSPSSQVELDFSGVELYCLYNETGIIDLRSKRLPGELKAMGEAQAIIPAQEAMDIIRPYLPVNRGTLYIDELTLYYTWHERGTELLRPTWVLKTSAEAQRLSAMGSTEETVTIYEYYAIDAITGEAIVREMKLKDAENE